MDTTETSTSAFDAAIAVLLSPDVEGGYVNDPLDPGGETHWGISKRAYPSLSIRTLTREDAIEIYRRDYWTLARCGEVPPALGIPLFDAAVNQGVRAAIEMLQGALGVPVDGVMGPVTIAATGGLSEPSISNALALFMARRGVRYTRASAFPRYGLGWFRRLFIFHQAALRFITT